MSVPYIPPVLDVSQLAASSSTGGYANAPSTSAPTATGASSNPSTSGFNAGLGGEHASADIPSSTKAASSAFVTPGLSSSPIVAALPSASSGIHSEGLTRAELNAKKAEVITGHKLEELTPREQAAAQLGVVGAVPGSSGAGGGLPSASPVTKTPALGEEPSLFGEANKFFHKATQAAYNAVPVSVIQKLESGNSPTASPTARRASGLFEQAKHVLGVDSVHPGGPSDVSTGASPVKGTTTIPSGTTVVASSSSSPTLASSATATTGSPTLASQAGSIGKDVGRRASAVLEQAKHLLGVDEVFPGGASSGHLNKGKESEMAAARRPSVADQAKGVADSARGVLNEVVASFREEIQGMKAASSVHAGTGYGNMGLATAGIVGGLAATTQTKPSEEIAGAKPGEHSDGVGALPGSIKEAAVAAPPDVKANPDPLGEGVGSAPAQSWHTASTDAAPSTSASGSGSEALAPALGAFVASTPAAPAALPAAIDAKPIAEVPVAADPKDKAFETGTPALPLANATTTTSSVSPPTALLPPSSVARLDSTASTDAIRHGQPGHGVTGAGIGLDADKSLPATPPNGNHIASAPSLATSSAPGASHEGVGSTAVNGAAPTNSAVEDKSTAKSEPHASVPEKFAAVGHGTVEKPASSAPAKASDETDSSANSGGRQGSTGSNGKKSGFLSKIKAKLHHDKD